MSYSVLKKIALTDDFLHSNSTTHKFLFGAIAEIVDNANDACAKNLHINYVRKPNLLGGYMVEFLDDGFGMDPEECYKALLFGCSSRRTFVNMDKIGKYGNGLKSSTLRIAKDFMIFSKKFDIKSIALLSRTFLKEEKIPGSNVYIAVPSFKGSTPWFFDQDEDLEQARERHDIEMEMIFKYSPFKNMNELNREFEKIKQCGTLVVVFNLLLGESQQPILQWNPAKTDIIIKDESDMGEFEGGLDFVPEERKSLRKYLSILYKFPRMKIFINGSKVQTVILDRTLFWRREYEVLKNNDKTEINTEIEETMKDMDSLNLEIRENVKKLGKENLSYDQYRAIESKNDIMLDRLSKAEKSLPILEQFKQQKDRITISIGINLNNRSQFGAFIYNQHRLLMMYKTPNNRFKNDLKYQGITIVVDVPYTVMIPKHDKQRLVNDTDWNYLRSTINDKLKLYMEEVSEGVTSDVVRFWGFYGYTDDWCPFTLVVDDLYKTRRAKVLPYLQQCNLCHKWRMWKDEFLQSDPSENPEWQCWDIRMKCTEPEVFKEFFSKNDMLHALTEGNLQSVQRTSTRIMRPPKVPDTQRRSNDSSENFSSSQFTTGLEFLEDLSDSDTQETSSIRSVPGFSGNLSNIVPTRRSSRINRAQPLYIESIDEEEQQARSAPLKTNKRARSTSALPRPRLNSTDVSFTTHSIVKNYILPWENKSNIELLKKHTANIRRLLQTLTPEEPNLFKNIDSLEFFNAFKYHRYLEDKFNKVALEELVDRHYAQRIAKQKQKQK